MTFRRNMAALARGDYEMAGRMIATMLVQGGPAFDVFSPCISTYLATGNTTVPEIGEIPDFTVRASLREVCCLS